MEEWRTVKDHPSYEVSSMGNVRKNLKQSNDREGYPRVTVDGLHVRVHQIMMEVFGKKKHEDDVVNHINGRKDDNRLCNLEYVTPQVNSLKAGINGQLSPTCYRDEIVAINVDSGEMLCFASQSQAAQELGCKSSEVNKALKGKRGTSHGYRFMYMRDYQKKDNKDSEWLLNQNNRQLSLFD